MVVLLYRNVRSLPAVLSDGVLRPLGDICISNLYQIPVSAHFLGKV